ncbi:senescence-associated carboxylesterase 101-like [Neltuma alba]|uniref:senescence-associated carboxylesterase 101-like n=1 Tax=Neltuma alba TaxID=207710 RepID=UPI0010A5449C|nr:senescence-associated carboxylesterase 101-like [Prosopis alba]
MTHNQAKVFSGGLESASSVVSSGILISLWKLISDLYAETHSNQNLFWKIVSNELGLTIITFGTNQNHVQPDLLPFSNDNPFKFICSKTNPIFSLNHSAFSLFNAYGT